MSTIRLTINLPLPTIHTKRFKTFLCLQETIDDDGGFSFSFARDDSSEAVSWLVCDLTKSENTHHRVTYHCTADLQIILFGFSNSTYIERTPVLLVWSAIQWYFPLLWVFFD